MKKYQRFNHFSRIETSQSIRHANAHQAFPLGLQALPDLPARAVLQKHVQARAVLKRMIKLDHIGVTKAAQNSPFHAYFVGHIGMSLLHALYLGFFEYFQGEMLSRLSVLHKSYS
jgi:hypothetical protein